MAANTTPKFWFDLDGNRYGARFMTIAEQAMAQVEIERLTNGKFAEWSRSQDISQSATAMMTQFAVYLNKVVVAWPAGVEAVNLLESDDFELVARMWEAYGEAAQTFRDRGRPAGVGSPVGEAVSASSVVP
jgi:hypothetical protein